MFDLQGFLALVEEMEKRRNHSAGALRLGQMDDDFVRTRPRQKPGPKPRNKSPLGSGKPYTGSTPVRSSIDDELRKRRGGGGGGGSTVAPAMSRAQAAGFGPSPSSHLPASPVEYSAIASGSQPAVVKLISFAAGHARISALLSYQSREGQLQAEDEAGVRLEGSSWVQDVANEWSEEDGRQPSKDVLRLSLTTAANGLDREEDVGRGLAEALPGHRIAWRSEDEGEYRRIELVLSTAARRQDGETSPHRIFDNRKSLSALERSLTSTFGSNTRVDVHGFAHGIEGVARYLGQLRKGGRHDLHSVRLDQAGSYKTDVVLNGPTAAIDEARDWKRDLRSQERRDVAHIVLSAKPGTSKEAFVAASRAMLAREFEGHRYVFALHEDRDHLHVHAVVKMRSETGQRLHPNIQDFKRWRETLAEEARQRDIPMDATSRFERANPPGYKMKDVRRIERGGATQAERRRVERVRNGEVHVPTREEGRRRAELTAHAWSETSRSILSSPFKPEPPERPGIIRLYRAERPGLHASSQPLFTTDRAAAAQIAVRQGGTLRYIDMTTDELQRLTPSRKDPLNVFVVDRQTAALAEAISAEKPAEIIRFQQRAAAAVCAHVHTLSPTPVSAGTGKEHDMADLNVMKTSFEQMETSLDEIEKNLPDDKVVEFEAMRQTVKTKQKTMLDVQEAIEKKRGKIEGEGYVPPKANDLANFVAEKRGDDVRYSHRKADGRAGAMAFTDHGDKVEIGNWRDREVVLAAMQVASEKWGSLSLSGTDRYKSLAIELAAEHGFKVTNPELQDALNAARQRYASRSDKAGIAAGVEVQSEPVVDTKPDNLKTEQPIIEAPKGPVEDVQTIKPADRDRGSMLAAMRQASEKWGAIGVNGTEREKALAVEIAAEHGFELSNPELQEKLVEARRRVEERRQNEGRREEKRLGFMEGANIQGPGQKTDAEIELGLQTVREHTQAKAAREVRQAERSSTSGERPFDGGGEDHAYRTNSEASAAQRAERSVEQNPNKPIAADINQSPEIERQRQNQEKLLAEKEAKRQAATQKPKNRQ
ncbi:LPD7 domain-containing protein [Agrobacterium tumefaciens]|uniref:LPD7 domain-containing protein n=1 Tax=Agrobacterium tumefaciens TaxID=358 RepID=UPI0021D37015|nr:LPD7 domain-containing protein [Agrobacterium tumefaciens]UXS05562.1 relaxase/mobilization nuclease domain-containing protein [Agrobacterium tumefaciens]